MINPLPKSNLFATLTTEQLHAFVDATRNPDESIKVMAFTMNLAHQLVEEAITAEHLKDQTAEENQIESQIFKDS